MTCEELGQAVLHHPSNPAAHQSGKFAWTEKRRRRRASPQQSRIAAAVPPSQSQQQPQQQRVISGMLPTLQALASLGHEPDVQKRGAICLVPLEGNADAASHIHATLLEAYCREIGLRLLRLPERVLHEAFGREHKDLGCLLVLGGGDAPFFLESPE